VELDAVQGASFGVWFVVEADAGDGCAAAQVGEIVLRSAVAVGGKGEPGGFHLVAAGGGCAFGAAGVGELDDHRLGGVVEVCDHKVVVEVAAAFPVRVGGVIDVARVLEDRGDAVDGGLEGLDARRRLR
jgi:hypothetical protein